VLRQQDIAMDLAHSARSAAELRRDLDRCPAPWQPKPRRGRVSPVFPWENQGKPREDGENHGKSVNYDGNRWKHDESWEHVGKS